MGTCPGIGIPFIVWTFLVISAHADWNWFSSGGGDTDWAWFGSSGGRSHQVAKAEAPPRPQGKSRHPSFVFDIDASSILSKAAPAKLMDESNTCWQSAISGMQANCRQILGDEDMKMRLALRLLDCFLKASEKGAGLDGKKECKADAPVHKCVKSLDGRLHSIFVAFYVDGAAMCHYLQSYEFNRETEQLVNDLKNSGHMTREQLQSLDHQISVQHARVIEHARQIVDYQKELQVNVKEGLWDLQAHMEEGMGNLQANIQEATRDAVEKLASSMGDLQMSLEDLAKESLLGQAKLLLGQEEAMTNLKGTVATLANLERSQIEAFEESKESMQNLGAEATKHRQESREWQNELADMHRRLQKGSIEMLKSQEMFVANQSNVFASLEKLFTLYNVILLESCTFKMLFGYLAVIVVVFMMTTTKQTQNARLPLYLGLCVMCSFEMWIIRSKGQLVDEKIRYAVGFMGLIYFLYSINAYRDYECVNHKLLEELQGNISQIQRVMAKQGHHQVEHWDLVQRNIVDQTCIRIENCLQNSNISNSSSKQLINSCTSRTKVDHEDDMTKKVSSRRTRLVRTSKVPRSSSTTITH